MKRSVLKSIANTSQFLTLYCHYQYITQKCNELRIANTSTVMNYFNSTSIPHTTPIPVPRTNGFLRSFRPATPIQGTPGWTSTLPGVRRTSCWAGPRGLTPARTPARPCWRQAVAGPSSGQSSSSCSPGPTRGNKVWNIT